MDGCLHRPRYTILCMSYPSHLRSTLISLLFYTASFNVLGSESLPNTPRTLSPVSFASSPNTQLPRTTVYLRVEAIDLAMLNPAPTPRYASAPLWEAPTDPPFLLPLQALELDVGGYPALSGWQGGAAALADGALAFVLVYFLQLYPLTVV
jgi:hypothetical protein